MAEGVILILRVQQLEDIFSIVRNNLRARFDILGLEENEVTVQKYKSRWLKPGDDCIRDLCGCEILFVALMEQ
jgi:hypothetical protein